jgi:hypothetical protein
LKEVDVEFKKISVLRFRSVLNEWSRLAHDKKKIEFDVVNILPQCLDRLALLETISFEYAHGIDFITRIMGDRSLGECERLGKGARAGALMDIDPKRDFMFNGYLRAVFEKRPVGLCAQYVTVDGHKRKCIKICLPLDLMAAPANWVLVYTEFLEPNTIHTEDRIEFDPADLTEDGAELERLAAWYSKA